MKAFMGFLPHLSIVLAGLLLVLVVVDYFNGSMGFLNSDATKVIMLLVSITSIVNALLLIARGRAAER